MLDSIWASLKTDWHEEAPCGGADNALFFPSEESAKKLELVRSLYCDYCPVRAKCLTSALINGDHGYWGGTSTTERNALLRTRHRAKCPSCASKALIDTEGDPVYQVCLSCAASWKSDKTPEELVAEYDQVVAL